MTAAWDAIVAAGSGAYELRFVVEGCEGQWVTCEAMAGALSDGRTRIPGLRREGLGFSERVYLAGAELEIDIDRVTVDEAGGAYAGEATRVLTTIAERLCPLYSTLASGDTTAYVHDGNRTLFTVDRFYHLGTETLKVTATADDGANPDQLTVSRGQWGTTAQEHPVESGASALQTEFYDAPTGWKARRCWLYVHTSTELATTDEGTCIWRGVLSREPALSEDDSLSWSFGVEPRTKLLDGMVAGGFDKGFKLAGIFYSGAAPFFLTVRRWGTAAYAGGTPSGVVQFLLSGFWRDQDAFCGALQTALNANATISGWGVVFSVRSRGAAGYDILLTTPAASPLYVSVQSGTAVDGIWTGYLQEDPGDDAPDEHEFIGTVAASTTYRCVQDRAYEGGGIPYADQRRVPRSHNVSLSPYLVDTDAQIAAYPPGRIYLDQLGALSASDDLVVVPMLTPDGAPYDEDPPPQVCRISSVTASTSALIAYEGGTVDGVPRIVASGSVQPTITGAARYASGDGDLEDFRADLVARAPTVANRGRGPWVTSDDFATGGWGTVVDAVAGGRAWLAHRIYSFAKPIKAIDVLREEWKLYGLIPYLDENARLAVRAFTLETTTVDASIAASDLLVDEGLGSITGEADGLVTVVHVLRGFDPGEGEHLGRDLYVRGVNAISRVHEERTLEIAPRSRPVGPEPTDEELTPRAVSLITLFGNRRTAVARIRVGLTAFGVLVGDVVSLTVNALPVDGARADWTPGAGLTAKRGIVIGRQWDLGEGVGTLEVLLHELEVGGYTPACRVTSAAGAGTAWTLTVTQSHYSEGDDTSYFASGQAIRIIEWDASAPTIHEGTVNGTPTSTTVAVTLATAWAGMGGATYYTLVWDTSDDAETTAAQLDMAYLGSAGTRVPLSGGTSPANPLAP